MKRFFIELDKAGSEWVIVAYLSGDPNMISVIEQGKSPHIVTGSLLTGLPEDVVERESKLIGMANDPISIEAARRAIPELEKATFLPRSMSIRQCAKKANHGLNFKEGWFMFAQINELPAAESKIVVHAYSNTVYPNLTNWWDSIQAELKNNHRTLHNLLGHKRQFLGMWGDDLWKSAISYKPQSTNAAMVRRGQRFIYDAMEKGQFDLKFKVFKELDLLANNHDSLLLSYPWGQWFSAAEAILKCEDYMSPLLEAKGRQFKVRTDCKVGGKSWAVMKEVKLTNNVNELGRMIAEAVKASELDNGKKKA